MTVVLHPGETVRVTLSETDGYFDITFSGGGIVVVTDTPDSSGRAGVIYQESFAEPDGLTESQPPSSPSSFACLDCDDTGWFLLKQGVVCMAHGCKAAERVRAGRVQ